MFSNLPDLGWIFHLALIGAGVIAVALLVGVPWLFYYLYTHLQWVAP